MYRVANLTILFSRGVGKHRRAALVGMTLETELTGVIGFDHKLTDAAVRKVAGRALDLAFNYRMMRALIDVNLHILVTAKADFGFPGLLVAAGMKVMAGIAGDIVALMSTQIP